MKENEIKIIPAKDGWDVVYFVEGDKECPDSLEYEPLIAWAIDMSCYNPDGRCPIIGVDPITVENTMSWEMLRRPDGSFLVPHSVDLGKDKGKALFYFQNMKKQKNNKS